MSECVCVCVCVWVGGWLIVVGGFSSSTKMSKNNLNEKFQPILFSHIHGRCRNVRAGEKNKNKERKIVV